PEIRTPLDPRAIQLDATALVRIILGHWDTTFARVLDKRDRALFYELRQIRNRWAHQVPITDDDVDRMADTVLRLLTSIRADNVTEVEQYRDELRRARYLAPAPLWGRTRSWLVIGSLCAIAMVGAWWWLTPPSQVPEPVAPTAASTSVVRVVTATLQTIKANSGQTVTPSALPSSDAAFPCATGQVKGNPNTMIYHPPDGAYYATTRNRDVVCFDTTDAAEAAGYRAAKR
ncbi:MAG: Swt1 family HEPN domain-containing protein, partial [Roseiflexaceae bacterium]